MYTPSGYNATSLFNLMTGNNVNGELSIVFSDGVSSCTLNGDDAMSVTISSSLTDDQAYGIGNFPSKQANLVLLSDSLNRVVATMGRYTGVSITISFQIATNVLVPMGVFYANPTDVISTEGVSCTLKAYDSAYYLSGWYEPTIEQWPATPGALIDDIISQHGGITLASDAYSGLNSTLLSTSFCLDPTISSQYYTDSTENQTDTFSGDGSTSAFTLSHVPFEIASCTIGGVATEDYTIDGIYLIFNETPASGSIISIVYTYIYSGNIAYNHESISYRQAIAHVAFLMGCNAVFDRSNKLKFIPFIPSSASRTSCMSITPAHYAALAFSKASNTKSYLGVLSALYQYLDENGQSQTIENVYASGSEYSNILTITTMDISSSSTANMFGSAVLGANGIDYQGYNLSMLYGFPYLDCGDAFTLTDYSGTTFIGLPIFSVTHTYNGSFSTSMSAEALVDQNVETSYSSSYKAKIDAMSLTAASANANAVAAQIAADTAWTHADNAYTAAEAAQANAAQAASFAEQSEQSAYQSATAAEASANQASISAAEAENASVSAGLAADAAQAAAADANTARGAAEDALNDAAIARDGAIDAANSAALASSSAQQAQANAAASAASASEAVEYAREANVAASGAVESLSMVEQVLDVLNWISEHAVYKLTADEEVAPGKYYFTLNGTAVSSPSGNPHENGYYELNNGVYSLTADTTVVSGKTYYTVTASMENPPSDADPSSLQYYEIDDITESVSSYVSTHLAVVENGLVIQTSDGDQTSRMLVSPEEGVVLFGPSGEQIASYGSTTVIGNPNALHIEITSEEVGFYDGNNDTPVAYISNQRLYITQSVVLNEMRLGENAWAWRYDSSDQSIYLKWVG